MDRAYEGNVAMQPAWDLGYQPVAPPLRSRQEPWEQEPWEQEPWEQEPWEYDRELYKRRNEIERLFRRLKGFRRVFTHYDKLDVIFSGLILFALIYEALR